MENRFIGNCFNSHEINCGDFMSIYATYGVMFIHTGAFGGKIAVATDISPFKTRVYASFSLSLGSPKCTVRVISVVPSNHKQ